MWNAHDFVLSHLKTIIDDDTKKVVNDYIDRSLTRGILRPNLEMHIKLNIDEMNKESRLSFRGIPPEKTFEFPGYEQMVFFIKKRLDAGSSDKMRAKFIGMNAMPGGYECIAQLIPG